MGCTGKPDRLLYKSITERWDNDRWFQNTQQGHGFTMQDMVEADRIVADGPREMPVPIRERA